MALIRTCVECGKRNDRPPFNQHGWIDYVCYSCGGPGNKPGYRAPYIPKTWPVALPGPRHFNKIPQKSQSIFSMLQQSLSIH